MEQSRVMSADKTLEEERSLNNLCGESKELNLINFLCPKFLKKILPRFQITSSRIHRNLDTNLFVVNLKVIFNQQMIRTLLKA